MSELLNLLRRKNPALPFYSVEGAAFRQFGRNVNFDAANLIQQAKSVLMPESGAKYCASLPELETPADFSTVQKELYGQSSCQIGMCWGFNSKLNCLEYHRSSEFNIAVSDLVLLLADQREMEGFELPEGRITAFYVPQGSVFEVYATTLHFCPCQTGESGFRCIVILPRGTNQPLKTDRSSTVGDTRLQWAENKWLIAHPEAPAVSRGAYPGLHGENYKIAF